MDGKRKMTSNDKTMQWETKQTQNETHKEENHFILNMTRLDTYTNMEVLHLGCYNTPPLRKDLVPRSRTGKTPGTQNGGDPRVPRWLHGRNDVTT